MYFLLVFFFFAFIEFVRCQSFIIYYMLQIFKNKKKWKQEKHSLNILIRYVSVLMDIHKKICIHYSYWHTSAVIDTSAIYTFFSSVADTHIHFIQLQTPMQKHAKIHGVNNRMSYTTNLHIVIDTRVSIYLRDNFEQPPKKINYALQN